MGLYPKEILFIAIGADLSAMADATDFWSAVQTSFRVDLRNLESANRQDQRVNHQVPKRGWKNDCGFCLKPLSRLLHPSQRWEE